VDAVGHHYAMKRHHVLILIVSGVLLVLAVLLIVGWANGGDAGDDLDQPPSGVVVGLVA
jgi:hypothetical protein